MYDVLYHESGYYWTHMMIYYGCYMSDIMIHYKDMDVGMVNSKYNHNLGCCMLEDVILVTYFEFMNFWI